MILVTDFAADGFYCRLKAKRLHVDYTFQVWYPYSDLKVKHNWNRIAFPSPASLDSVELEFYDLMYQTFMRVLRNPPTYAKGNGPLAPRKIEEIP
jgi:hypothetical protein